MLDLKGRKVLVLGLGVSGYAATELLAGKGANVSVSESSITDEIKERLESLKSYQIQYETGAHTKEFCYGADLVVTSPGIDTRELLSSGVLSRESEIIGELELGFRFCPAPVIAVTGTNGKSTTTKLIGEIISRTGRHTVACGNIGNPLCGEVGSLTEKSVAVVEVSSFQLGTINKFKPHIAILLNVAEDHYDRHNDFSTYKHAKFNIFKNQSAEDWAVVHTDLADDPLTKEIASKLCFYGIGGKEASVSDKGIEVRLDGRDGLFIGKEKIPLEGKHNMDNVACAALVAKIMDVSDDLLLESIEVFKGLGHRFERVGLSGGIEFIDDSKATNLDATEKALRSMDKKVVLIAGGIDKGGDYNMLMPLIREKVKAIVVIGEARDKIKDAFSHIVPVLKTKNMESAVREAYKNASDGEAVMLSPMCSSFDMFTSYKQRGEAFQEEVQKVMGEA